MKPVSARLSMLRRSIDRVDGQLVRLLGQRARLGRQIGVIKRRHGIAIFDRKREALILRRIARLNRSPLSTAALHTIYRDILRANRALGRQSRKS